MANLLFSHPLSFFVCDPSIIFLREKYIKYLEDMKIILIFV